MWKATCGTSIPTELLNVKVLIFTEQSFKEREGDEEREEEGDEEKKEEKDREKDEEKERRRKKNI